MKILKHGDFTSLAENYAKYRPGYSKTVLQVILSQIGKKPEDIDFADIGAGTGIWTRMVARQGCRCTAVEPDDAMREHGILGNEGLDIQWVKGFAEDTGLPDAGYDLVSMASAFHWADFQPAITEFERILRPGGIFVSLWNPRLVEINPMLVEIEAKIKELVPDLKRVSSGRSEFCTTLTDRLYETNKFTEVLYVEGRHVEQMTPERYVGIWRSVNDIQVQAGPERFEKILEYIKARTQNETFIEATYLTPAWLAYKPKS